MLKFINVFILLIFLTPCHAQDTTKAPGDTLVVYKDSLGIFNDTLSTRDTTGLLSTKKNIAKRDSLVPLFSGPLSDNSYIITNREMQFTNYRSTEDLLELYPFYYYRNYGSIGYPVKDYLFRRYSVGYLQSGIPVSGPPNISTAYMYSILSTIDLNTIQSEDIDSIEIIPAPRSYLYSISPSLINFITKDQVWLRPYTRVKYYQGAYGEALFDGIFNSVLYKKLYGYLDVTNRKFDQSYANTNFSSWQVTARLRYLFSNDYNVIASYNYGKLYKGLNGGVNVDSIGVNNRTIIFNEFVAPVRYYHQDLDQLLNNYEIKLLAKPFSHLFTEASLYYHFYESDLNNIKDSLGLKQTEKSWNKGLILRNYYNGSKYFNLNFNFQYENGKIESVGLPFSNDIYNLSFVLDFPVSDVIIPAVFYKYYQARYLPNYIFSNEYYQRCLGADIKIVPFKNFSLYAGYSKLTDSSTDNTFQVSAAYNIGNLFLMGEFINRNYYGGNYAYSGSLQFRIGSFIFESRNIFDKNNLYNFREGIYFLDSLFRPNLLLKAGFFVNILGPRSADYSISPFNWQQVDFKTDYSLDFTLAGEIRRAATIYFTWENILNRQYFVVPYYPMQGSNVRFGIAWELLN